MWRYRATLYHVMVHVIKEREENALNRNLPHYASRKLFSHVMHNVVKFLPTCCPRTFTCYFEKILNVRATFVPFRSFYVNVQLSRSRSRNLGHLGPTISTWPSLRGRALSRWERSLNPHPSSVVGPPITGQRWRFRECHRRNHLLCALINGKCSVHLDELKRNTGLSRRALFVLVLKSDGRAPCSARQRP